MSAAAEMTDHEFRSMLRQRTTDPRVRTLMALLNHIFDGDGYTEDEDGFSWLVIDASRIVDFVDAGRELNPGFAPDDRASILNALEDSGRWCPDDPVPESLLDALEAAFGAVTEGPEDQQ